MSPTEVAERHHRERRRLVTAAEVAGARLWRRVDTDNIGASWSSRSPELLAALIVAQRAAADQAEPYTAAVLRELGVPDNPAGEVTPSALSGQASDGRDLRTLLMQPIVTARTALARGRSLPQAMASGQAALRLIVRTQVADAGRVADGITIATREGLGYIRHVTPPSCPRCAILAGRWYRYNAGFLRHPACDCFGLPAPERFEPELTSNPRQLFEQGQIRGLSKADTKAIADGADMNQVVNARRGMQTASVHGRDLAVTSEGMTRRGFAHRRIRRQQGPQGVRLMPEEIYRLADSRAHAIELLRRNAYIV